ncbi:HAD family hydrolase [Amycolatopsis sp. YIM 10]|uniref:HAD family hydrolase n=1 Tax=Amycolatopsis sp. YIM 10 TaxID=2653857 RepID=UPI00128FD8C1|nr:HAD-IA family hydrolase [Amycolatopsis sp. YIM 10]QFU85456.1 Pyrophosphatase PpaX [Amycolatopsis sp. YIM 10]
MGSEADLTGLSAIAFDFDGTLFRLPVDFAGMRAELGLDPDAKLGDLFQRFLDEGNTEGLDVVTRYERESVPRGEFTTGARELLEALTGRYLLAIVTRNSRHCVFDALGNLADGLFVIGREDVARLKPDPEGVHAVLKHYGVTADEAVLVGDTYHDVEAAHAAGARSVIVRNDSLKFRPEGADTYIETLSELRPALAG